MDVFVVEEHTNGIDEVDCEFIMKCAKRTFTDAIDYVKDTIESIVSSKSYNSDDKTKIRVDYNKNISDNMDYNTLYFIACITESTDDWERTTYYSVKKFNV